MKKSIIMLSLLATGLTLASCQAKQITPSPVETGPVVDPIDDNYRVFYEIFTCSFSDSNGDGVGDIKGITNRMDYLNDGDINSGNSLGVQGLWLTPIFKSPSYHKYDASDYYSIDPSLGTLDDFKELLSEAKKRNVKVIIDLAINHTSSEHPWFSSFISAHNNNDTENEYYDWYTYYKKGESYGDRTVAPLGRSTDMYECNFSGSMPELNYDNQKVREEMVKVAKYWLDLGVDGFRFDAIKYIYYGDDKKSAEFWDWYMTELKKIKPDIYTVGECWSADSATFDYFSSMNCFNFTMSQTSGKISDAAKGGNIDVYTNYVQNYLRNIKEENANAMMCPFISNHDMDRAAGYVTLSSGAAKMAANLYLLCSGSPFIYYGEEIGMKGTRGGANTDANRRLAMLWGDNDTVNNPIGSTFEDSKQLNGTVASQLEDPDSLLNYYKNLIAIRNKYPAIARGTYTQVTTGTKAGGFLVTYNGENIGIIHNATASSIKINLSDISQYQFTQILEQVGYNNAKISNGVLTIGARTSVILK